MTSKAQLPALYAKADRLGIALTRVGLIVVLVWIGLPKAFPYEADGIVPFVANSPFMSFFYADPGNYKAHMNPEGAVVPANRAWHEANRTYPFAIGLGTVIVLYGVLIALNLQTAFLSPPMAMSAYYLRNVMPKWSLADIYRGMGQFMVIQVLCLALVLSWPLGSRWSRRNATGVSRLRSTRSVSRRLFTSGGSWSRTLLIENGS